MYLWELLGHDPAQRPLGSGIGDDLPLIMRTIADGLRSPAGFVGRVTEVVPRISVFHLGEVHVPTGREWAARRDRDGVVRWTVQHRPVDPDVAYTLAGASSRRPAAGPADPAGPAAPEPARPGVPAR